MPLYRVGPISSWPWPRTPEYARRRSPFKSTWGMTVDLLETELRAINASNVVMEIDVQPRDVRNDGELRADARPATPAVVISCDSKWGPLRYPCDTFTAYQDNVRAIALALEALRKVDRYGVTKRGEQYTGWKALPPAGGSQLNARQAAEVLARYAPGDPETTVRRILNDPNAFFTAMRNGLKATHPDTGGKREDFDTVQAARKVLAVHHGNET